MAKIEGDDPRACLQDASAEFRARFVSSFPELPNDAADAMTDTFEVGFQTGWEMCFASIARVLAECKENGKSLDDWDFSGE